MLYGYLWGTPVVLSNDGGIVVTQVGVKVTHQSRH